MVSVYRCKDSRLCGEFSLKTEDNGSTCCKEIQVDGEILKEVHGDIMCFRSQDSTKAESDFGLGDSSNFE